MGHGKSQSVATATTHLSSPIPYTPASLQPGFTEEPSESKGEGEAALGLGFGAVPGALLAGRAAPAPANVRMLSPHVTNNVN